MMGSDRRAMGPVLDATEGRRVTAMTTELSQGLVPGVELEVAWLRQPRLPFELSLVRATPHTTVIILQGEVDLHTAPRFRDAVARDMDEGARAIAIDFTDVSFIDATGLGVVVWAARRLGLGAVALVLPHRGLVRIFRICGLDRLLDIYETREQALRGLPR
jgi:anti-sigma B factor antagonist